MFALAFAVAVTVFFFCYAFSSGSGQTRLLIQEESQTFIYPLNSNSDIFVSGPLGKTRVHIRGGEAFVADSPCRDKLCLSMGRISRGGLWIACLPNRVFLRVESSGGEEVDAAAY